MICIDICTGLLTHHMDEQPTSQNIRCLHIQSVDVDESSDQVATSSFAQNICMTIYKGH